MKCGGGCRDSDDHRPCDYELQQDEDPQQEHELQLLRPEDAPVSGSAIASRTLVT